MLTLSNPRFRLSLALFVGGALLAGGPSPARAQDPAATAAEISRLKADVSRLEQELQQQKQLLIQLMQSEQQRYDMLMQLIRSGQVPRAGELRPTPTPPPGGAPALLPPGGATGAGVDPAARSGDPAAAMRTVANVSGRVRFPAEPVEAYVYVEGLRGGSGRGRVLQIKQEGKQFIPAVAVVLTGTKLTFPNFDTVAHNAFSNSPGNAFDLGSINAGEKSAADVTLSRPGPVTVHCNIHAKMRADILVTASTHFAKVRPDGSFEISSVPVGVRKVTLWSPDLKAASQTVEVSGRGASVTFSAQASARGPHLNKLGRSYGSYNE
jgi:plastocyanin